MKVRRAVDVFTTLAKLYAPNLRYVKCMQEKKNSVALVRGRSIPTEQPQFVREVRANFSGWRVSRCQPYGRILEFLDRSRYFFFRVAPQLYSTRLSAPQTHYFSENLVSPGIEPGPLYL
jgi:hypothetical protein